MQFTSTSFRPVANLFWDYLNFQKNAAKSGDQLNAVGSSSSCDSIAEIWRRADTEEANWTTNLQCSRRKVRPFSVRIQFNWLIKSCDSFDCSGKNAPTEAGAIRTSIEGGIKVVREGCCDVVKAVQVQKKPIDDFVSTGIEHSQCELIMWAGLWRQWNLLVPVIPVIYDYLNEPSNGIHRAGAITVGALSGYIIGIRRGFIRRLLYTSIAGLGVASVCYPKEAREYSQQAIAEAKTYATIVYNFAYGGPIANRNRLKTLLTTYSLLHCSETRRWAQADSNSIHVIRIVWLRVQFIFVK